MENESKLRHKAQTRLRILDEAAKVMREYGTDGIGVAALMKRVGLTHGGFYAHFSSREALVDAVVVHMFLNSAQRIEQYLTIEDPRQRLVEFIDNYLSERHCAMIGEGCPLPALAGEMTHLSQTSRTFFSEKRAAISDFIRRALQQLQHGNAEFLASSMLAEMVGSMALARACPDKLEAHNMLAISRQSLKLRAGLAGAGQDNEA